jgi:exodeoxyribonuclease VII large subunit
MQEAISLYQLNQYIKQVIAVNFDEAIWIRCELASVRFNKGHVYLELVENNPMNTQVIAQSSAVIWAGDYLRISGKMEGQITQILKQGSEVQLLVELQFHERYGFKLNVRDIDLYFALGKLEIQRREIMLRLQQEELLDRNKKIPLPLVPQRIAVISSSTAAGYADFMAHIENNAFNYSIQATLYQATMQGDKVAADIIHQLNKIDIRNYDCVVIIRGGGSKLDLADFDSYELGKYIAEYQLPILTGIGHEIDVSIADLVSHRAFKTPTAVADFILTTMRNFDLMLKEYYSGLYQISHDTLNHAENTLNQQLTDLNWKVRHLSTSSLEKLAYFEFQFKVVIRKRLDSAFEKLNHQLKSLDLLDFQQVLKRGFTITSDSNGSAIKFSKSMKVGQLMTTWFQDGKINSKIENITPNG